MGRKVVVYNNFHDCHFMKFKSHVENVFEGVVGCACGFSFAMNVMEMTRKL